MKLTSAATLRALMAQKGVSYQDMALAAGVSKGFISHLTAGRRNTMTPRVAERIARRLDVPLELLVVPSTSITGGRDVQSSGRPAA
ncbi:helix-turn-helix transcriptional regulator [Geodermatophilus chilensis]|uniref:helix-turn-helix transcriptional regulator n=1 Tax=Geodermatophilus chilensis TaxID=2035835 RepID=UPI0018E48B3D|nr:helix-turn-helix transcriptional regulator [Geodermatophilus chilensis]